MFGSEQLVEWQCHLLRWGTLREEKVFIRGVQEFGFGRKFIKCLLDTQMEVSVRQLNIEREYKEMRAGNINLGISIKMLNKAIGIGEIMWGVSADEEKVQD